MTTTRPRAQLPSGNQPAIQESARRSAEAAEAERRTELEKIDADLTAAGTPGLRVLEDFEARELLSQYGAFRTRRTGYQPEAAIILSSRSSVPPLLVDMVEFVELNNRRRAVQEAHARLTSERQAWKDNADRIMREYRDAVAEAATRGEPAPERPTVEPWQYDHDGLWDAIEQRFLRVIEAIEATERGVLKENAETYLALATDAAGEILERKAQVLRQLAEIEQESRPAEETIKQLRRLLGYRDEDDDVPFSGRPTITASLINDSDEDGEGEDRRRRRRPDPIFGGHLNPSSFLHR